jgi:intermediate cleaving peptidase 55
VKSAVELGIMKRAADISAAAHRRVMRAAAGGMAEGRLVAEFEYECALRGSERAVYVPVVASG